MKTIELKFYSLCDEIDYWKEKARKAEEEAEYWKNEYSACLHESIVSTQRGVANALMFALSVTDNIDGSLSISKESRKELAEGYK